MDDLISRQAAIEAMTADNLNRNLDSVNDDDMKRAARAAQRALARLPTAVRWIPVTEPPEEDDNYLCYLTVYGHPEARYRAICYYDAEDGFCEDGTYTNRVTHWMPLPEPPKEEP